MNEDYDVEKNGGKISLGMKIKEKLYDGIEYKMVKEKYEMLSGDEENY